VLVISELIKTVAVGLIQTNENVIPELFILIIIVLVVIFNQTNQIVKIVGSEIVHQ
jgi:hypothetical protein